MNEATAYDIVERHLIAHRSLEGAPRVVRRALDLIERLKSPPGDQHAPEQHRLGIDAYDELVSRGDAYMRRAEARKQLANYIQKTVIPHTFDHRLMKVASKLRKARKGACWGFRPDGSLVTCWDDKSGLAKLDPDEAREESKRLAERYGAEVLRLVKKGHGLHFMVLTIPNVAAGELAKAQKAMFTKWVNFKRKETGKRKLFSEFLGDIAIMESPLAADGRWNVHLNVLVVTRRPFEPGLYEKIRREWRFNCHMRPVKGDTVDIARAFNELIKYGAQTVPEKSQDKASRHQSDAPAMTEWPASRFLEWFDAQQGFRRTRTYGCLYGSKVPKPEPRDLDDVTWCGRVELGPARFRVTAHPIARSINSIPGDKSTAQNYARRATGPPI